MEGLGNGSEITLASNWFDTRDDGDGNTLTPARIDKTIVGAVVKEHLRDNVLGATIHFLLQHLDIIGKIWGLCMLLWIAGHSCAKMGLLCVLQLIIKVVSLIEPDYLGDQITGVLIATLYRYKSLHSIGRITAKSKDILHTQEVQLHQCILKLVGVHAPANQVCNHGNLEGILNQS